jgi:RNA polymerase sigma-70 factor (sigma-E family)
VAEEGGVMSDADDIASFTAFVEAGGATLFRTAYLIVGDYQLAQDLVQEALVKTLLAWPRLSDHGNLDAYVRRIIVTTCISWRRRRAFHERPVETLRVPGDPDHADSVATHDALIVALGALPPRQRAAIVLRYYQDLTEAQTAEAMGCSVGAVKSQVSVGLRRLRASLGSSFDRVATTDQEVSS